MRVKTATIRKQISDAVQESLTRDIQTEVRKALSATIETFRLRDTIHTAVRHVAHRQAEKLLSTKDFRKILLDRVQAELALALREKAEVTVRIAFKKRPIAASE